MAGRKSLMNTNVKRLKRLQEINDQLSGEKDELNISENNEDKENSDSPEEKQHGVLEYDSSDLNYSSTNDQ